MKLPMLHKVLAIVVLLLFSFSCASDLDFDQANDLKLEPIVVANLAYFNVEAKDFAGLVQDKLCLMSKLQLISLTNRFLNAELKKWSFCLNLRIQ